MPLQATSGAASYDAFGGGVPFEPTYIEQIFQTWLYTGNGNASSRTIENNIDLSTYGGMVWIKARSDAYNNNVTDTVRGARNPLRTNTTGAQDVNVDYAVNSFLTNGFTLASSDNLVNRNTTTYASWTFRKQPKFFDVVTYTGNGVAGRTVSHNLGSEPGCLIVKCTSTTGGWATLHKDAELLYLQSTNAQTATATTANRFGDGTNVIRPTDTVFTVGTSSDTNSNGATYVAYLFAHDAGGFGLTGTDNVISCGSFTTNSSASATVNLGWEPQWVLIKSADQSDSWFILDNMRGWVTGGNDARLLPNSSNAEATGSNYGNITATGFVADGAYYANSNHIYIAIRRGPMKVPTTGTSVFTPVTQASFNAYSVGFPTDLVMGAIRGGNAINTAFGDRLRGGTQYLVSSSTAAEANDPGGLFYFDLQNSMDQGLSSSSSVFWNFRRAPGFFDEVCYTGTGSARTVTHNLTVAPELMIVRARNDARDWMVYCSGLTANNFIKLNLSNAQSSSNYAFIFGNDTTGVAPTSSVFTVGSGTDTNGSGNTYVAYLFASCPGVSKVGSYTGNGSSQTINCGFTGGARFVLIKQASGDGGDWFVFDTARGIGGSVDPWLALNRTLAEQNTDDAVDPASVGFIVNQTIDVNLNGQTYIFLAIA
jgi:hypothetical protein